MSVQTIQTKPVKPWDYQRLSWNGSGLTSGETLVAQYLAWKARSDADEQGWFTVSKADIAKACKIRKRDTVAKYLDGLYAKGWADRHQPVSEGKYLACRYRLTQPLRAHETGMEPCPRNGHGSMPKKRTVSAHETGNEVRSYFTKGGADDAVPSGGGSNAKENQTQAPPAPAQPQAARPNGANNPETLDHEIHALIDAERQTQQLAELAAAPPPPKGDPLTVTCRRCRAAPNQPCNGLDYVAGSYLDMHRGRNHGERLVDADKHTRLAAVPA